MRCKILLLSKDAVITNRIKYLFETEDYSTISLLDGKDALPIMKRRNDIGLILIEASVFGVNELDLCREIKYCQESTCIPIILLSTSPCGTVNHTHGQDTASLIFMELPNNDDQLLLAKARQIMCIMSKWNRPNLQVAKQIQESLLPKFDLIDCKNFIISPLFMPYEEVSGDFYDVIDIGDNKTAFFIMDAPNHGVSAALICATIVGVLRSSDMPKYTPSSFMELINEKLCSFSFDGQYPTAFYCIADFNKNELVFSSAGHHDPIIFPEEKAEPPTKVCGSGREGNLLLGMSRQPYVQDKIRFARGDKLLMYTDGLFEMQDSHGEQYGKGKLHELVDKNRKLDGDKIISKKILPIVENYRKYDLGGDDITAIIVEFK